MGRGDKRGLGVLESAEASGLAFLGLLLGLAQFLFLLGFLFLLFDGHLNGAKLEELLPLFSLPSVSHSLLLLGWEEQENGLDGEWSTR